MQDVDVNWLAVLVAAIAAMPLGAVWYSPMLFARPWMRAIGKSEEEMRTRSGPGLPYLLVLAFVAWLVVAYVLSWIVDWAEANSVVEGLAVGFLCFFGFVLTGMAVNTAFAGRGRDLLLIDGGHLLLVLLVQGAIVGAWQ